MTRKMKIFFFFAPKLLRTYFCLLMPSPESSTDEIEPQLTKFCIGLNFHYSVTVLSIILSITLLHGS